MEDENPFREFETRLAQLLKEAAPLTPRNLQADNTEASTCHIVEPFPDRTNGK